MTMTEVPQLDLVAVEPVSQIDSPAMGRRRAAREAQTAATKTRPSAGTRSLRSPLSAIRGTAVWVLATVAILLLWFVFYALVMSPFQEQHAQADLYSAMRLSLAQQVAPLGGNLASGTPMSLLTAPSLGIHDVVVVEGTGPGDLMNGPGHRRDTVLPGQAGVSVIYGRSALFGGPFATIGAAHVGETLTLTTGQGVFTYVVEDVRRPGDRYPQPLKAGEGRLTLVSADGGGHVGSGLSPAGVVYLDATLAGKSQPSPGVGVAQVPTAETAMQGDISALFPLALTLPLLIAAILLVVWLRSRWGGWQTWLVGAPLILATLWAVSASAVQLLPNLL